MLQSTSNTPNTLDFIAVGAGPSNLSLAIQATEQNYEAQQQNWVVLEKQSDVRWHPGMLLPHTRLDTHFAKDLVTMVNPTSKFSFLNYLKCNGRLEAFLNCGNPSPYRADFDRYIQWAGKALGERVQTSCEVNEINQASNGDYLVQARQQDGTVKQLRTRNVVIGAGAKPRTICGLDLNHPRVIHSSEFLYKMETLPAGLEGKRVLVVGGGQSAAELMNYFIEETEVDVTCVVGDFGLKTKEGTAFVNESYNGDFVERFFHMSPEMRSWFVSQRRNMNYGVVDDKLINTLYNNRYFEENFGGRQISFLQFSRMISASANESNVDVHIESRETLAMTKHSYDYVILACGYDIGHGLELLGPCNDQFVFGPDGRPTVNRDYSIKQKCDLGHSQNVYLNGNVSYSHGPAGDVLSIVAHRSQDILGAINNVRSRQKNVAPVVKNLEAAML